MIDKVETSVITRQIRSAQQRVEPRIVFDTSLDILRGRTEFEVSSHYLINELGDIYRLVDDAKRAWHAGKGG